MDSSEITLEAVSSASQVAAEDWDACANPVSGSALDGLDTLVLPENSGSNSKYYYNPDGPRAICSRVAMA